MKTVYINYNVLSEKLTDETIGFYTQYLFTEHAINSCFLSYLLSNRQIHDKWKDEFIINSVYHYQPKMEETMPKNEILKALAIVNKIKKKKNRNSEEQKFVTFFREMREREKKLILTEYNLIFENAGILEWADLFTPETVFPIANIDPRSEFSTQVNYFGKLIEKHILETGYLHFFNANVFCKHKTELEEEYLTMNYNEAGIPGAYRFPLFTYPVCFSFTKEQMKTVRSSFLRKIKPLSDMIISFADEINAEDFGKEAKEKTSRFSEKIKPEAALFQQLLDSELYIQQHLNSCENPFLLKLNVAVTSVETLTRFYENNGILVPFLADALRKELALHTDVDKCRLILYWTFGK